MDKLFGIIEDYLECQIYKYALMINGKWGCGKTFFIKDSLIPLLKKQKREVIYLSLYGVKDTDEIGQKLCVQAFKDKRSRIGKLLDSKNGQIATALLSSALKYGIDALNLDQDDLKKIAETIPKYNKNVLIFDDLERCSCSINDVLGYINNFVEHSEAKVIIVANEEEIKEERYLCIKEKVIGHTIEYLPNLKKVFEQIIKKNFEKGDRITELLLSQVDDCANFAGSCGCCNIRTFQFFLEKIDVLAKVILQEYYVCFPEIIRYAFVISLRYANGKEMPKWNEEYGNWSIESDSLTEPTMNGFKFVDDLIVNGDVDAKRINAVLKDYITVWDDGTLKRLFNWHTYTDDGLKMDLNALDKSIMNGKYSTLVYAEVLSILARLKAYSINPELCDKIVLSMKNAIETHSIRSLDEPEIRLLYFNTPDDKKAGEIYKGWYDMIIEVIRDTATRYERDSFLKVLKDRDSWGKNIYHLVTKSRTNKGYSFIYWIEPEDIFEAIEQSNNEELYFFRLALNNIYSGRSFHDHDKDDLSHLRELKRLIDEASEKYVGMIKSIHYMWISRDIQSYIESITTENDLKC